MGLAFGVLGKFGLPSVDSLATDKVYDNFFNQVKKYEEFHWKLIEICSKFNSVMPGKHYVLNATDVEIKKLYEDWKKPENKEKETQKEIVLNFLKKHVDEYKASSKVMMATGLVAPGAAVLVKRASQNVPQLKKLRPDLVPNAVFVPTITLLSVIGVRMITVKQTLQRRQP